ncbi:MAG: KAP family NTPase [Oscillospiraceae bacterium]|nr:KAP family NTPase [Oscillospiraceae bacterium]
MFYSDKPIMSNVDDQLSRGGFAKLLAQALINLNSADTFSVGLYGKWGSGKTSLINMMLNEIEEQQRSICEENRFIVVHFDPWNFSEANQLLSQFFIRLSNEFRSKGDKNLSKIGEALETYSDAFDLAEGIPVVGGILALLGKKGATALGKKMKKGSDEKDILKQKEYVISLLKKQVRKILVVIDDIDRLNNEQIRQVFQLITSVAKFPNTIYLLAFDKEIVVKALKKVQEGNGEDYLEKIIQMPIQIPDIQREKLREVLFDQLNLIISEYKDISFQQAHWQRLFEPCVDPFIKNIRDINRLCNSVQFKLTTISSEVDFADMVAISALEVSLPQIYEWIKNNKSILTGELDLSTIGRSKSQKEWYELYDSQIQSLLHSKNEGRDEHDAEIAITFLSRLFPHFGQKVGKIYEVYDLNTFRKNNQIAHSEKFDRYFNLDLDNIGLKKSEIIKALYSLSCEDFRTFLLDRDEKGTSYEFLEEVQAMIPEISPDRAKVMINALLDTSAELDVVSNKNILSMRASSYADYMIIDLIDVVAPTERLFFLSDIIHNTNFSSLQSMANVINMLELGYGRLAAKGEEKGYKKVLSLEELIQLEGAFTQKVKDMLNEYNLFDFGDWRMICYLLERFDSDYAKKYLTDVLNDDKNIVKYLDRSVSVCTGSGTKYEVKEEYKKYLTGDRVLQAIESLKRSGDLFLMPEQIQNKCGAFFLNMSGKLNYHGNIAQFDVDKLLSTWKG